MITVELTDAQTEIADWYMGSPAVELWMEDRKSRGAEDWTDKNTPTLEDNTFKMPEDEEVIEDFKYRVNEQYIDMARQVIGHTGENDFPEGITPQKFAGIKKASDNLVDKVEAKHNH